MVGDITVVVPYYNESKTIERTLERLLNQTLSPREVLLVDSGSTDHSSKIILNWIERNPGEIQFRNVPAFTGVPSSSKNVGAREAKTEFVAFMDCGLDFEDDWLEKLYKTHLKTSSEFISGVCHFTGIGLIDQSAIAHTYGFDRKRPCIPSSLIKKSTFERVGYFTEGRRAGYDAEWITKARAAGVKREVCFEAVMRYFGLNFTSSLKHLFRKSILYSRPNLGLYKHHTPYIYLIGAILGLLGVLIEPRLFPIGVIAYIILRGWVVPILKSQQVGFILKDPRFILVLPIVGFVMDSGRLIGYVLGTYDFLRSDFVVKELPR